jgi:hypothetical protein
MNKLTTPGVALIEIAEEVLNTASPLEKDGERPVYSWESYDTPSLAVVAEAYRRGPEQRLTAAQALLSLTDMHFTFSMKIERQRTHAIKEDDGFARFFLDSFRRLFVPAQEQVIIPLGSRPQPEGSRPRHDLSFGFCMIGIDEESRRKPTPQSQPKRKVRLGGGGPRG